MLCFMIVRRRTSETYVHTYILKYASTSLMNVFCFTMLPISFLKYVFRYLLHTQITHICAVILFLLNIHATLAYVHGILMV